MFKDMSLVIATIFFVLMIVALVYVSLHPPKNYKQVNYPESRFHMRSGHLVY